MALLTLLSTSLLNSTITIISLSLFFSLLTVLYRLYLHPLSHIPGPRLAAATYWYEFYYIIFRQGAYTHKHIELHKLYGPIIRINPGEVHISDPDFFEVLHAVGSPFEKDPWLYSGFGMDHSMFAALSNKDHRQRREPLKPFFARRNIIALESVIRKKVDIAISRVAGNAVPASSSAYAFAAAPATDLHVLCRSLSTDVIWEFALGLQQNLCASADMGAGFQYTLDVVNWVWILKMQLRMPRVQWVLEHLPPWMERVLGLAENAAFNGWVRICVEEIQRLKKVRGGGGEDKEEKSRSSIFKELMAEPIAEEDEAAHEQRMVEEAFSALVAGGETSGGVMGNIIFHVLNNPGIHRRLAQELVSAYPDPQTPLSFTKLETLPFFAAVVKEGLRTGYGFAGRLPRIVPRSGSTYAQHYLPAGARISMSGIVQHTHEAVFPDPWVFRPERWMGEEGRKREKYLVPFGRGSRACIGMHLAGAEIMLMVAGLVRQFEMCLDGEVREQDLRCRHAYVAGFVGTEARHLKVRARRRRRVRLADGLVDEMQ